MTNWRTRALLGASTAAVLIALVPFSGVRSSEREVLSRIGRRACGCLPHRSPAVGGEARRNLWRRTWRRLFAAAPIGEDKRAAPTFEVDGRSRRNCLALRRNPVRNRALTEILRRRTPPRQSASQPQPAPLSPAAQAYRKGDVAALAALAAAAADPDERLALEWAALARRSASDFRRARGLRQGASDLARARAMCATGRRPTSSFIRRPLRRWRISSPRSRRSRAPASSRLRARPQRRDMWTRPIRTRPRAMARRQFRRLDGERDPARLRRRAFEVRPQVSRRPSALRRELGRAPSARRRSPGPTRRRSPRRATPPRAGR